MTLAFEWDEAKNRRNFEKHGFSFEDARVIFENFIFTAEDDRRDYGEKRFISVGILDDIVVVIAYTLRNGRIRIISIRKANKKERKIYEERTKEAKASQRHETDSSNDR